MDIIKWRASYETGVTSMDNQHRKLIELINTMYKVMRNEEGAGAISLVLKEMNQYADGHLKEEETLLEQNNFPELNHHHTLHENYRSKMTELSAGMDKDVTSGTREIYSFLRQWWLGHIVEEDQKYGKFLTEKGVK